MSKIEKVIERLIKDKKKEIEDHEAFGKRLEKELSKLHLLLDEVNDMSLNLSELIDSELPDG